MAYISKITLPSGSSYDIKDAEAREQIAALAGTTAVVFVGVSSTALTDGGTETPTVSEEQKNPEVGQLFFYGTEEFIWGNDNKWHALGSLESLGSLAYKDNATTSYIPAGSVSQPDFAGAESDVSFSISDDSNGNYQPAGNITGGEFTGSSTTFTGTFTPQGSVTTSVKTSTNQTTTVGTTEGETTYTPAGSISTPTISVKKAGATSKIHNPTATTVAKTVVAAAPGATAPTNSVVYYAVAEETLSLYQLGYTTGDSITTDDVDVKTGDAAYESSQPTFTGTGARLVTGNISVPSEFESEFDGTPGSVSTSGTPNGSNSALTFNGTKVKIEGTTIAEGSVSQPTFSGSQATITVS